MKNLLIILLLSPLGLFAQVSAEAYSLVTNKTTDTLVAYTCACAPVSSFAWSKVSGPGTQTVTTHDSVAVVSGLQSGFYIYRISTSTGTDTVGFTVSLPVTPPPVVTPSGPDTVYLKGTLPGLVAKSNTVYIGSGIVFTGQIKLDSVQNVQFVSKGYGFTSTYSGYSVFSFGRGGNQNISISGFDFGHSASTVFDASTKIWKGNTILTYDGTPGTAVVYGLTVDGFRVGGRTMLYQGTYEPASSYHMVSAGITFRNGVINNDTTGQDIRIQNNAIYGLLCENWTITGPTINHYDCGIVYISGSATLRNIKRSGGWGYLERIWITKLAGLPFDQTCGIYNCLDINSTHYGTVDVRNDPAGLNSKAKIPITGGEFYFINNTSANKVDGPLDDGTGAGQYVTNAIVLGDMKDETGHIFPIHIKNNFAGNADNRSGMAGGSSLLKNNATYKIIDSANNVDLKPGVPIPAGYFFDQINFIPITGGPAAGVGYVNATVPAPVACPVQRTIKTITYSDGTIITL